MIVTIRKRPVVLRVVHTQAMLFLKSTSERDGSDIQRLWNWMKDFQIDSESIKEDLVQIQNGCMSDPSHSDISKIKWRGSGLPLNCNPVEFHSVSKIYWRYQILNKDCPNEVITRFIIQWNFLHSDRLIRLGTDHPFHSIWISNPDTIQNQRYRIYIKFYGAFHICLELITSLKIES